MKPGTVRAATERPQPENETYTMQTEQQVSGTCRENAPKPEVLMEENRHAPRPGSMAEQLHRLYLTYIGLFPPDKQYPMTEWADTIEREVALQQLFCATRIYCCKAVIRPLLEKNGLWRNDLDSESLTVFHDAFLKLLCGIFECRYRGEPVVNYAGLALKTCRNRCIDYLKLQHPGGENEVTPPRMRDYAPAPGNGGNEGGKSTRPQYVDPYRTGEDGTELNEGLFRDGKTDVIADLEKKIDLEWMQKVLYCYVRVMMDYDGLPEKVLGLCYGRVLYQMVGRFDPEFGMAEEQRWDPHDEQRRKTQTRPTVKKDPVHKQPASSSSPGWAIKQMQDQTFRSLQSESAAELSRYFGFSLYWGQAFCQALQESRDIDGTQRRLDGVRYRELCTQEQVRGWCNSIHNTLLPRAFALILQDESLVDCCEQYLPTVAKSFLNKGAH